MGAKDDAVGERFNTVSARIDGHWALDDERWTAHHHEHGAATRAEDLAREALDDRLKGLNEFRGQLSDQAKGFVTRDAHDQLAAELDRRIETALAESSRRFDEDRHAISLLQSENNRLLGALAVARFVGFGGLMTGLGALVWVLLHSQGAITP